MYCVGISGDDPDLESRCVREVIVRHLCDEHQKKYGHGNGESGEVDEALVVLFPLGGRMHHRVDDYLPHQHQTYPCQETGEHADVRVLLPELVGDYDHEQREDHQKNEHRRDVSHLTVGDYGDEEHH